MKKIFFLCVTCHMLHVTCHLSPTLTATATATEPPPANSPTMHSRLVCLKPKLKNSKHVKTQILFLNFFKFFYFNFSDLLDQKSPVHAVPVVAGGDK